MKKAIFFVYFICLVVYGLSAHGEYALRKAAEGRGVYVRGRIGAAREEHHLRIHVRLRIIACGRERNKAFAFVVKLRHYGKRAVKLVLGLCEKAARGLLLNHQHHARYPFGIAKEHKHNGRCYIIGQVAHLGKFAFRAAYVELQYVAVHKR